ncbi:MAG: hypothetical protein ACE5KU_05170 [Nitrososphaerales archaeon]
MRSEITPDQSVGTAITRLYQMDTETLSTSDPETFFTIDRVLKRLDQIENYSLAE